MRNLAHAMQVVELFRFRAADHDHGLMRFAAGDGRANRAGHFAPSEVAPVAVLSAQPVLYSPRLACDRTHEEGARLRLA